MKELSVSWRTDFSRFQAEILSAQDSGHRWFKTLSFIAQNQIVLNQGWKVYFEIKNEDCTPPCQTLSYLLCPYIDGSTSRIQESFQGKLT